MMEAGSPEHIGPFLSAFLFRSGETRGSQQFRQSPRPAEHSERESAECNALASAVESMFEVGKEPDEVAAFLDALLQRHREPQEAGGEPNQPLPPAGAASRHSEAFVPSGRPGG
jgi:hypothetical protein